MRYAGCSGLFFGDWVGVRICLALATENPVKVTVRDFQGVTVAGAAGIQMQHPPQFRKMAATGCGQQRL
jgi:hypothetical protein